MANRNSFIDFVRGLLTTNPLERWSPQQAKLHPFITQQKFTGPFVPPMNLKSASINKTPAPGIQQQQQAEALSKQRAQQQQAAQIQAQNAMASAAMQMGQYPPSPHVQSPSNMYNMYTGQAPPPPYPTQTGYGQQIGMLQPAPAQMHYAQPPSLHPQVAARAGRPRASTNNEQGGIPPALQRVVSHLDPNAPIRLAPSPAYYPPPPDGATDSRRRASRAAAGTTGQPRGNRDFIRTLEDRSIEEGYMNANQPWH